MQAQEVEDQSPELQAEGRWDQSEHDKFLQALMAYGKNWKMIEEVVQTRTTAQVRSHAQKFFLKIQKIEKERKKNAKKGITEPSKIDQELTKSLLELSIGPDTPSEIITFLRLQSSHRPPKSQDQVFSTPLSKFKEMIPSSKKQILDELLEGNDEQSFLLKLMQLKLKCRRQTRGFGDPEQALTSLIAFPQMHREEKEEEETANKRKKSFSLYEEDDDSEKYNCAVKKMRGG